MVPFCKRISIGKLRLAFRLKIYLDFTRLAELKQLISIKVGEGRFSFELQILVETATVCSIKCEKEVTIFKLKST